MPVRMISVQEEIPDGAKYRPRSVPSEWFFCNQARKIPGTSRVERNQILVRDYFAIAAAGQFVPRRRASARGHRGLGRCEYCGAGRSANRQACADRPRSPGSAICFRSGVSPAHGLPCPYAWARRFGCWRWLQAFWLASLLAQWHKTIMARM